MLQALHDYADVQGSPCSTAAGYAASELELLEAIVADRERAVERAVVLALATARHSECALCNGQSESCDPESCITGAMIAGKSHSELLTIANRK